MEAYCYCCGTGVLKHLIRYMGYYCNNCYAIFSRIEMMLYEMPSADYDVPPRTWAREWHGGDGPLSVMRLMWGERDYGEYMRDGYPIDEDGSVTDLAGSPLTMAMIEDAVVAMKKGSDRFREEGYRYQFQAWQWREAGFKLSAGIPDNAMVSMAEFGPMLIVPSEETWH